MQLEIWSQVLDKYKVQYSSVIGQLTSWSLKMTNQWRKNEEMGVWDPCKEMAVFWEIKTFIMTRYRALRKWAVCLYPGKR